MIYVTSFNRISVRPKGGAISVNSSILVTPVIFSEPVKLGPIVRAPAMDVQFDR